MSNFSWIAFPVTEQIRITEMYSLFTSHRQNGYTFSGESHNFWECLCVLEGEVCVSADDRVYNMTAGEIIFHKPMELHKFSVNNENGVDLLIFSFFAEGSLLPFFRDKVFRLSEEQSIPLKSLLSYIEKKSGNPKFFPPNSGCLYPFVCLPGCSQMVTALLYQLFLSLADEGTETLASVSPDAVTFQKAVQFLNSRLSGQPTVPEIARFCNVSEASLKRIFNRYAGISIHKYFLKLKIQAAAKLLQEGESAAAVSEKLGFSSQSYFTKVYKRELQTLPSQTAEHR